MKFTLVSLLVIILLIGGGLFAVARLGDPSRYVDTSGEAVGDLHRVSTKATTDSEKPAVVTGAGSTATVNTSGGTAVKDPAPVVVADPLLDAIKKLRDAKTVLKLGSKGAAVGTVQEFMNVYFEKSLKIDNDFGKTLEANVKEFQKQNGVQQTGQIGPLTWSKMVEYLQ